MNKFILIVIAIALLAGVVKYLNYRGDKKVEQHLIENAKMAVNDSANMSGLPKPSIINSQYMGTMLTKMKKVDDLTLEQTLQLDKGYDNLSEKDTSKIQKDLTDSTISQLCAKKDIKDFIKVGMVNLVNYEFNNGKKITQVRVDKSSCEPYWKAS